MSDELPSLAEIKAAHPGKLLIPLAEAAPFISKTPEAAYKLAIKGALPGAKKLGGSWVVNVKQLAEFIDSPSDVADARPAPSGAASAPARAANPKGRASRDETSKTVRPPPMSKILLAMRRRIEQTRAELDLQLAVYAELEREDFERSIKKTERGGRPREF